VGDGQRMVREVDGDDMRWVHVVQGRGIRCSRRGGVTEKTRGAGQDGDLSLRALQFTWGKPSPGLWAVTCFVIPRHKEQLLGEAGLAKSKCRQWRAPARQQVVCAAHV
jgi:hypothetical protein